MVVAICAVCFLRDAETGFAVALFFFECLFFVFLLAGIGSLQTS